MATTKAKKSSTLLKFHVLQGFNYVLACAYFAYLALGGSEAKPKMVSKLWMTLEDPPLNPLERILLAMFWLCPFCIGLGYIFLQKHLETVYGSFLTIFMGVTTTFRLYFTPAQYLNLLIVPVDLGGLIYKLYMFREEFYAIPKSARHFLWNVPEMKGRSTQAKQLEIQAYVFALYMYALSYVSTDLLMPGYQGPRVSPFSKIFFVTQAVIFVFCIPALRKGQMIIYRVIAVNKCIVLFFLCKGILFDNIMPGKVMSLLVLVPYMTTLVTELSLFALTRII